MAVLFVLICFAVPVFVGDMKTEAADTTSIIETYTADAASTYFKNNTAPTCKTDGYIFAGWYAEDDTVEVDETTGEEYFTGNPVVTLVGYMHENVKALFVEKSVLDVKGQIAILDNADGSADDGNLEVATVTETTKANLRLVTSVDSLKYQNVGFEISYTYDETPVSTGSVTNYVYKNLTVVDGTDGAADEKMVPSKVFSKRSKYFKACTVNGVPKDAFNTDFSVRAFWQTADGATVYGSSTPISKSVQAGIYHTYEAGVDTTYYKELESAVASVAASETEATVTVFKNAEVESDMGISGIVTITNREGANVTIYRGAVLKGSTYNMFSATSGSTLKVIGTTDENSIVLDGRTADGATVDGDSLVSSETATIYIENVTLRNAKNTTNNNGGAIQASKGTLTVKNVCFVENSAKTGAAIRTSATKAEISNCVFGEAEIGNEVTADGGAIYNQSKNMTIVNSKFLHNTAQARGGAIYNNAGTIIVKNSKFENNTALTNGGAINTGSTGASLTLTAQNDDGDSSLAKFIGNQAQDASYGGGAINMTTGNLIITGYIFENNHAKMIGGAIRTGGGTTRTITDATFKGNYTKGDKGYGGAVYIGGTGVVISNTTFEGNYTEGSGAHGGALYLAKPVANTTLENITYIDNAVNGSGAEEADLYSVE